MSRKPARKARAKQPKAKAPTTRTGLALRTVTFTAVIPRETERERSLVGQEQAAKIVGGVSAQTLRDWVAKGMPREGTAARPQYDLAALVLWTKAYRIGQARHERESGDRRRSPFPDGLTIEEARELVLEDEMAAPGERRYYVIVPLEHDHPARARQLARAARGMPPAPIPVEDDEGVEPMGFTGFTDVQEEGV